MKTSESAEMYLETIMLLQEKQPQVRSIDVVRKTGYTKPSVSRAVGLLRANGHIEVDENGYITLTAQGKEVAARIVERHHVITDFLISLGVDQRVSADDACKMEHIISDEVFEAMKRQISAKQSREK